MRSDGVPLYNLGAVVDDITMGITLVARGRDHMINTPIQILLYEALGQKPPQFAHLPMMLGADGQKLSKRHGAVAVGEYRDKGIPAGGAAQLPGPLRLVVRRRGGLLARRPRREVRLGALRHRRREVRRQEVRRHRLRAPQAAPSSPPTRPTPTASSPSSRSAASAGADRGHASLAALPLVRPRAQSFVEAADALDYFFRDPPAYDEKAVKKFLVAREGRPAPASCAPSWPARPSSAAPAARGARRGAWLARDRARAQGRGPARAGRGDGPERLARPLRGDGDPRPRAHPGPARPRPSRSWRARALIRCTSDARRG